MARSCSVSFSKSLCIIFCCAAISQFGFRALGFTVPTKDYAVQATATAQENPPQIHLSWPGDPAASSYEIYRREMTSGWQQVATIGGGESSWTDGGVSAGTRYEYKFVKHTADYTGYGYLSSGIHLPALDNWGKIVLVVESSLSSPLTSELNQLQSDLTGEGWQVVRRDVSMNDSPQSVKAQIKSIYDANPANVKAVFLFGHVPVPYSGNINPDGHPNHQGAWPADSYYADMDGIWTDSTVNTTNAERDVNWNVPGDGRLDQSVMPSDAELMVGRVDLYNMTCYANKTPSRSEIDLMRQYVNKDHAFRFAQWDVQKRGLMCDNFADKGDDPISESAWRNWAGFFGANNVVETGWDGYLPAATSGTYLWSYGSGGGSYYYSTGVATSDDFATQDVKVVFTMFLGSYFGDWNNESNFLRAALGSGYVLTSTYSGAPHTIYFPMGMGEPIGYCIRLTQNNATNTLYAPWVQGTSQTHIALMGDPSLRLSPVKPASSLNIASKPGTAVLNWSASNDSNLQGYYVYRAASLDGPYTRLTDFPVGGTSFSDTPPAGNYAYMVRAIKLEQSPSGTYLNPSQGIFATATVAGTAPQVPVAPSLQAQAISDHAVQLQWNAVANALGYKIERETDGESWSQIAQTDGTAVNYSDQGLAGSTAYSYRIRAFNDAGDSPYSEEAHATTPATPPPVPDAPVLQANAISYSEVDLQWTDVSGETAFSLERKTGAGGSWAEIAHLNAGMLRYLDNAVSESTDYVYRIRALNSSGPGAYSSEVQATTPAAPQAQASVLYVKSDSTTDGNWTVSFGALGWLIPAEEPNLPASITASLDPGTAFVWESDSTDPRAPLSRPAAASGVAGAWSGTPLVFTLNSAGTDPAQVALYFLDWDEQGRALDVTVRDVATSRPLDARVISGFAQGEYLVYKIKGKVQVTITNNSGPNAVLSGIFLGGPISNSALKLTLGAPAGKAMTLTLQGDEGQRFEIQSSTDLKNWQDMAGGVMTGASTDFSVPASGGNNGPAFFLRAVNKP